MGRLEGKVAIITGAAQGMGAEHAREFVKEGAKVVITDILEDKGKELSEELGENSIFVKLDITQPEDWKNAIEQANESFGLVTVLVNNAGYTGPVVPLAELEDEDYLRTISIDQNGTFFGMKAVIPQMLEAGVGSIVNISSVAGIRHGEGKNNSAYTAAKHAVIGLTKATAVEYGAKNIRVNAILPGTILTPMMKDNFTQEQIDSIGNTVPVKRLADTKEVSKPVLFLASDDSSYLNGTYIPVDGAWSAKV